jgi:hypothetical protein
MTLDEAARPKTAQECFEAFDQAHPDIWRLFKENAFKLIRRGHDHWSADAILHVIRFEHATSTQGQLPKINNNLAAAYSRKWAREFPEYRDFFQYRDSKFDQQENTK